MIHPSVSIITVCYNAKDLIEPTINSVRKQNYDNFEYIIIDGDSNDGTKEIIEQNRDAVDQYLSEPDKEGEVIGKRRLKEPEVLTKDSFLMGMLVCHQAAIVKRSLARHYNTKYKITADYDWLLYAIEKADPTLVRHSKRTYCYFLEGGVSRKKMWQGNRERYQIMIKHYGLFKATRYNIIMTFRFLKDKIKGTPMT